MPAFDNREHGLRDNRGPAVAALARQAGERYQHIELRKRQGGRLKTTCFRGDAGPQLAEQLVFQLFRAIERGEHFFLVFLQFGRDIALGVFDGLFANVMRWNLGPMHVRDFKIVAEDFVETNLEAGDARALGLLGLIAGNPLFASGGELAQFVEPGVEAGADKAAFTSHERAIVFERGLEQRANLGAKIDLLFEPR